MSATHAFRTRLSLGLALLSALGSPARASGGPAPASAGPILSEVMADPAALPDAQGEFLELANPGADTLRLDSLRIEADAQSLVLSPFILGPGAFFLLCRDSLPSANGGMECRRRWPALSLANSRAIRVDLVWEGGRNGFAPPPSRPGVSWENTWEEGEGFRKFLPAAAPTLGGDSATPGYRNSRSVRKPSLDLGLAAAAWVPAASRSGAAGEGYLDLRVENRGSDPASSFTVCLGLDADWDGEAETALACATRDMPEAGWTDLRFPTGSGMRGIVHARLAPDQDPGDDLFLVPVEPGRPLGFTEWHPAPEAGVPEWVEIRNRTGDSGGLGRRLDLAGAAFNGLPLGPKAGGLDPGEFLVLAESAERFRARYGPIKARVLQPSGWRPLRNTGDTLELALAGFTVDSLVYGPEASGPDQGDLSGAAGGANGTPGYAEGGGEGIAAKAPEKAWTLSGRVAGPGRPIDIAVGLGTGIRYAMQVFDLEGNPVRDLGAGTGGSRTRSWDGRGDGGRRLHPGPYILCIYRPGFRPRRETVIVVEGL